MPPEDAIRIRHMIDAAETAQRFAAGRQRDGLDADQMLLFALVRAIEIIGEAASRVTQETRAATPTVPWAQSLECGTGLFMHISTSTKISYGRR